MLRIGVILAAALTAGGCDPDIDVLCRCAPGYLCTAAGAVGCVPDCDNDGVADDPPLECRAYAELDTADRM